MKKSELTSFIKEEILSVLNEDAQTQQDIKDTEELTKAVQDLKKAKEDAGIEEGKDYWADYTDIGQSYLEGFGKKHSLTQHQLEKLGKKIVDRLYKGDVAKAYDDIVKRNLKEDDDAPAGDKEVEKKASKQDIIIKNYQKLQRDLKRYLKSYKEAKGEAEKQDALKNMKKISQSAEYLDAKDKYEKLKKV